MNFKKIFFAVFTTLLVLTSCNNSSQLSDAIPADANYILYVNNKSLVEKSQYDIFTNPSVQKAVDVYKVFLKDEAKIKALDDFIKNANTLGLNLKEDFYIYTNYKVYGLVIGVNDAKKIQNLLLEFQIVGQGDIKKEDNTYSFSPESGVSIAWDDHKLIVLADISSAYRVDTNSAVVNVSEMAIAQLKQGADKSINSNKSYAEFSKSKKDISVFYSFKGIGELPAFAQLADMPMGDMITPLKKLLAEMKGVSVGLNTSFEKGEIAMSSKYYFETPDDEAKFKDYVAKITGTLKGDQLKYITSEPLFLASINIKGDGIYNYLNDLGIVNKINKELPDSIQPQEVEKLMKNFTGDVTFALVSLKEDVLKISDYDVFSDDYVEEEIVTTIPQCVFFADVTDTAGTLSFVKEQMDKNQFPYKELTPLTYSFSREGINVYFGVSDNMFFVTNIQSVYDNLGNTGLKNNYADQIKDKYTLISGDLQSLKPYLENKYELQMLLGFVNELGKYSMTVSSVDFTGNGKIEFNDKEKNSLAVICQQIDQLISKLASSSMGF